MFVDLYKVLSNTLSRNLPADISSDIKVHWRFAWLLEFQGSYSDTILVLSCGKIQKTIKLYIYTHILYVSLSLSHQSFRGEFCDTILRFKGNIDNCQPTWEWVKTGIHLDSDRFSICFGMPNETGNDVPQIHWIIIVS